MSVSAMPLSVLIDQRQRPARERQQLRVDDLGLCQRSGSCRGGTGPRSR